MKLELRRVKERSFPYIDQPGRYTKATIWHCNFSSIDPIKEFFRLRELKIATFPDDSLSCLSGLERLEYLRITHLPKVTSLDPLAGLSRLKTLALSTLPSWDASGKKTEVDSFAPLSQLESLRSFTATGVVSADRSLMVLGNLPKLREVQVGNQYPIQEFAGLLACRKVKGTFFSPTFKIPYNFCKKCGEQKVMLSGVTKYNMKCPVCHAKRVAAHLEEWNNTLKKSS